MYSNIFDSHAHYDDKKFKADLPAVMQQIANNGVVNVLNAGCDIKSSKDSIRLCEKYPFMYASAGIHPHEAANVSVDYLDKLRDLLSHKSVVALGEIGLDYHYDFSPREVQKRIFEQQLILAGELSVPVIIHSREAAADTMELLHKYKPSGVVHCFTGSAETAKETVKLGMYIGFTGVVTFPNARKTLEVIAATPLERILLETDCPYMAPVPYRGQRTTSDMIAKTAETVAGVKGIPTQELIDIANSNTKALFGI